MIKKKINIAVIGATGYVGLDLIYLLSKHPKTSIKYLCARKNIGRSIQSFDSRIKKKFPKISEIKNILWKKIDLVFLSLPNREAQKIIRKNIKYKHIRFIDLSADFRIKDPNKYKNWYKAKHLAKNIIPQSLYSVSEFVKNDVKKFRVISNPGCYPTSIQLALIPLFRKKLIKLKNITIDSKSGYSGAGKNFKKKFTHKNIDNSVIAYGIKKHRHMSELDQEFNKNTKSNVEYIFNPHVVPTFRGLLSSIYLELNDQSNIMKIYKELKNFHKKNRFVRVLKLNKSIGTGNVIDSNFCEISVCETRKKNRIVIFSAIDNLIKGASGQAIQNMNLAYGFKETIGLI